jgi:hypothetical protein
MCIIIRGATLEELEVTGIILNSMPYKEKDRLVHIFSVEIGNISAIFRGVESPRAKLKYASQPFCFAKFDFRPTALFRYYMSKKDNIIHEQFITFNVNTIVNMCFNDNNKSHFNSIETLWDAIHSKSYKYPEELKDLEFNFFINCWKKGWTNIVPENFNLKYWTNEQIWEGINKQSKINKVNNIICNLSNMENK